jgi:hypothetical protein
MWREDVPRFRTGEATEAGFLASFSLTALLASVSMYTPSFFNAPYIHQGKSKEEKEEEEKDDDEDVAKGVRVSTAFLHLFYFPTLEHFIFFLLFYLVLIGVK